MKELADCDLKPLGKVPVCPIRVSSNLYREDLDKLCTEWPALLLFSTSVFDELVFVGTLDTKSTSLGSDMEEQLSSFRQTQELLEVSASAQ
jgi:hypothetical protein